MRKVIVRIRACVIRTARGNEVLMLMLSVLVPFKDFQDVYTHCLPEVPLSTCTHSEVPYTTN